MLRLSDSSIEWLQARLPGQISNSDLEGAYSFEHPFNRDRGLIQAEPEGENFLWRVQLFAAGAECVFMSDGALVRWIYLDVPLCSSASSCGPVAYNDSFRLKRHFQRSGLATIVYREEALMYARWGLREIHMMAIEDGPAVWIKKFAFRPKHPGALEEAYVTWARQHGVPTEPPADPAEYPEPFLNSRPELELFKVIA